MVMVSKVLKDQMVQNVKRTQMVRMVFWVHKTQIGYNGYRRVHDGTLIYEDNAVDGIDGDDDSDDEDELDDSDDDDDLDELGVYSWRR